MSTKTSDGKRKFEENSKKIAKSDSGRSGDSGETESMKMAEGRRKFVEKGEKSRAMEGVSRNVKG